MDLPPRYGRQFEVRSYPTVLPATIQGIQRYLGWGLIKGIGPVMAGRMVAHFGTGILRVIEEEPQRLIEVPGVGPKRTQLVAQAWEEQKAIKEVMVFLQEVGVSTSLAVRIFKRYREAAIGVVRAEPYRLAADVWGIGFKTADAIAAAVGIAHDSPERINAGLQYTLSEAADNGHCYLPAPNLVTEAGKILGIGQEMITPPGLGPGLAWLRGKTGTSLAPEQEQAVRLALTKRVAVLTGGPGCGKSLTVRSVVELARAKNAKIVLAAPTGRAAKRLAELTGHPAATVHRLLQLQPGGDAKYDRDNPLDADLVVVDESSMIDLILADKCHRVIAGSPSGFLAACSMATICRPGTRLTHRRDRGLRAP